MTKLHDFNNFGLNRVEIILLTLIDLDNRLNFRKIFHDLIQKNIICRSRPVLDTVKVSQFQTPIMIFEA